MQYDPLTYIGNTGQRTVNTAAGPIIRDQILIEAQILNPQREAMTPWFEEVAIITPDGPGLNRLSGNAMRNHLYFATAPGNGLLYVAKKKNGIVSQLPVV